MHVLESMDIGRMREMYERDVWTLVHERDRKSRSIKVKRIDNGKEVEAVTETVEVPHMTRVVREQ